MEFLRKSVATGYQAPAVVKQDSDLDPLREREDFKKLLTRHGLNLIAERVEDEKTVVQLLDYAVDYAQGYLFGEPRAVREPAQLAAQLALGIADQPGGKPT